MPRDVICGYVAFLTAVFGTPPVDATREHIDAEVAPAPAMHLCPRNPTACGDDARVARHWGRGRSVPESGSASQFPGHTAAAVEAVQDPRILIEGRGGRLHPDHMLWRHSGPGHLLASSRRGPIGMRRALPVRSALEASANRPCSSSKLGFVARSEMTTSPRCPSVATLVLRPKRCAASGVRRCVTSATDRPEPVEVGSAAGGGLCDSTGRAESDGSLPAEQPASASAPRTAPEIVRTDITSM